MLDKGILLYSPHIKHADFYGIIPDNVKNTLTDRAFVFLSITKKDELLAAFLLLFLALVPPTVPIDDFILRKYLNALKINFSLLFRNAL